MNESKTLASYVADTTYEKIPSSVVNVTKRSLLDGIGIILAAGTLGQGCQQVVNFAIAEKGKEESTIIGFDAKVSASMAAFANGSMMHGLDYEDSFEIVPCHPNASSIPAALAVAESIGNVNGKELITALTVASDVSCRLGLAVRQTPRKYGFFLSHLFGAFGAAAASCKLLRLNSEQILDAFSLTLGQATGSEEMRQSARSIILSIGDAFPAKAGVMSALLAKAGIAGEELPFEGKFGFFTMYSKDDEYDASALTNDLGKTFHGANVSVMPWPCGRVAHAFIEAALRMIDEYKIEPGDIKRINIVTSPRTSRWCEPMERKRNPLTVADAQQSLPYSVAVAFARGRVGVTDYTPEALRDPVVLDLTRKTMHEVDTKPAMQLEGGWYRIEIRLEVETTKHGKITSRPASEAGFAYGHPTNPVTEESLIAKFMDCAAHSAKKIPEENLNKVVQSILHLEDLGNIAEIMKYL